MSASVKRQFSSLTEGLCTPVYPANEGLLIGMRVLVLSQVLGKRKHFRTKVTLECLLFAVDIVVALEGKLSSEALSTTFKLALEFEQLLVSLHGFILRCVCINVIEI